jgi:hypothetical protein
MFYISVGSITFVLWLFLKVLHHKKIMCKILDHCSWFTSATNSWLYDFTFIMVTTAKYSLFLGHTFSDVYLKCICSSICTVLQETSHIITQFSLKTFILWVSCSFSPPDTLCHGLIQSALSSYPMEAQIQSQSSQCGLCGWQSGNGRGFSRFSHVGIIHSLFLYSHLFNP